MLSISAEAQEQPRASIVWKGNIKSKRVFWQQDAASWESVQDKKWRNFLQNKTSNNQLASIVWSC